MRREEKQQLIRYVQQRWGGPKALRLASESGSITTLPTDIDALDGLLNGGLPAGRITTLRGTPSSGATTLAHTLVAASQRREYEAVYVDTLRCFDPASATRAGADLDRLTIIRPDDDLEALAIATTLARSTGFDLIVFDYLAPHFACEPGGPGGSRQQGVLSTWLGCMATLLHGANTAMLFLAGPRNWGPPGLLRAGRREDHNDLYHGGRALAHYSSVILTAERSGWLRDRSNDIVGMRTLVSLTKSKTGVPGDAVEIELRIEQAQPILLTRIPGGLAHEP